jgi:hypothetical protein
MEQRWCKRVDASDGASFRYMRAQARAGHGRERQSRAAGHVRRKAGQGSRTWQAAGPLRTGTRTGTVANVQLDGIN